MSKTINRSPQEILNEMEYCQNLIYKKESEVSSLERKVIQLEKDLIVSFNKSRNEAHKRE